MCKLLNSKKTKHLNMCMIMMIFSCVYEELNQCIISYYYHKVTVLLREQLCGYFSIEMLRGEILFLSFRFGFLEIGKKGGYFGLGMGPIFSPW